MFCKNCGKQLPENAKFCTGCGQRVVEETPAVNKDMPSGSEEEILIETDNEEKQPIVKMASAPVIDKKTDPSFRLLLLLVVLVIGGLTFYYFRYARNTGDEKAGDTPNMEQTISNLNPEEVELDVEPTVAQQDAGEESSVQTTQGSDQAVSSTNEVVNNKILAEVPKAVYSYSFENSLDGAEIVVRDGDVESGNNPGTLPSLKTGFDPQYTEGIEGNAIRLDGTYGVQLSNVKKVGGSYTIAFWMNAEEFKDWSPFVQIGSGWLDEQNRSYLVFNQKTDGYSVAPIVSSVQNKYGNSIEIRPTNRSSQNMLPNAWYYIVLSVDGNKTGVHSESVAGSLYVGGELAGAGDMTLDIMNTDDMTACLGINCWDQLYKVSFDEVKIWDQALSGEQIKALYDAY